jgi:hypothetical protein
VSTRSWSAIEDWTGVALTLAPVKLFVDVYPILHRHSVRARMERMSPKTQRRRSRHVAAAAWALGTSVLGGSAYASPSAKVTAGGGTLTEQPQRRPADRSAPDYRLASALGLAGTYAALGTWMWFAWYADKPRLPQWRYGGDGWFGSRTYAGGADKLGHVWTNLALSRLGTELLRRGGWNAHGASFHVNAE